MLKATINDVAKLAGVSIKTVSRVVNNEPNVRKSTRKKVEVAIIELNYRPNLSARNLASKRSHLIGLLYDDPSAYELPSAGVIIELQQGVLKACKSVKYDLLIHPCNYRDERLDEELTSMIEQRRPVGIILAALLTLVIDAFLMPASLSPAILITAVIISIAVGVLAGIVPAWRGARLDPIESLHYE